MATPPLQGPIRPHPARLTNRSSRQQKVQAQRVSEHLHIMDLSFFVCVPEYSSSRNADQDAEADDDYRSSYLRRTKNKTKNYGCWNLCPSHSSSFYSCFPNLCQTDLSNSANSIRNQSCCAMSGLA
ncbi:hypothetical protein CJ030_MR6G021628 [Morella rubra]|uniref:Uncharacterized protein n=1 Tax=Morella rubra TaxID=262757 RepID=A0A6A1VAR5_9ROSI|nr:hypothetical protein CJ030_MR6G026878 [Morella rubra]KAB1211179.1 hypothetical protein CJ030_MR6G021631 [Morella rubra]KAB1211182.1 hypothetical protein CJ030_MR6G021628 [Morella rubra]